MNIIELEQQVKLPVSTGDQWSIDQSYLSEMSTCYPHVDIEAELLKMRAWLISNPSRRKTNRGMKRFINSWLSRAPRKDNRDTRDFVEKHTDRSWRDLV